MSTIQAKKLQPAWRPPVKTPIMVPTSSSRIIRVEPMDWQFQRACHLVFLVQMPGPSHGETQGKDLEGLWGLGESATNDLCVVAPSSGLLCLFLFSFNFLLQSSAPVPATPALFLPPVLVLWESPTCIRSLLQATPSPGHEPDLKSRGGHRSIRPSLPCFPS